MNHYRRNFFYGLSFGLILLSTACARPSQFALEGLPNRALAERDYATKAFHVPQAHLLMPQESQPDQKRDVFGSIPLEKGEGTVLHATLEHYDRATILAPDYTYQLNVELRPDQLKAGRRILAADLRAYLTLQRHMNDESAGLYFIENGFIKIIHPNKNGSVLASFDLHFRAPDESRQAPLHVRGRFSARPITLTAYEHEQAGRVEQLYEQAERVETQAWAPEKFRSMDF